MVNVPELQGVGHIALTVTDPMRSAAFYNRLFDAQTLLTVEDAIGPLTICISPAMMFAFRTHPSTGEADRFDPARVGLDHLGFHVADQAAAGGLADAAGRAECHQLRDHRG